MTTMNLPSKQTLLAHGFRLLCVAATITMACFLIERNFHNWANQPSVVTTVEYALAEVCDYYFTSLS